MAGSCFQSHLTLRGFQFTVSNLPRRQEARIPAVAATTRGSQQLGVKPPSGLKALPSPGLRKLAACSGCLAAVTLAFPARGFHSGSLWRTLSSSLLVLPVGSILIVPSPSYGHSRQPNGRVVRGARSLPVQPALLTSRLLGAFSPVQRQRPPRNCAQEGQRVTRYRGRGPGTELLNHSSGLLPYKGGGGI